MPGEEATNQHESESDGPELGYDYSDLASANAPLPDSDSFRQDAPDPLEQAMRRQQEIEYAQLMVERASRRAEAEVRRQPSERNDSKFDAEMALPVSIEDPVTGINYSTFRTNIDKEGDPLVLCLGLGASAETGAGRDIVHEYSVHIDRPIIVIDNEGMGRTDALSREDAKNLTLDAMGKSRLRVLDAIGVDAFDIAGYSLGAGVALATAAEAGDRVRSLITFEGGGFEHNDKKQRRQRFLGLVRDAKTFADNTDPSVVQRIADTKGRRSESPKGNLIGKVRSLRGQVKAKLEGSQAAAAAKKLSASVHWTDVVGDKDALTDWQNHLTAVRQRNEANPGSSDLIDFGGGTHYTIKSERAVMAETAARVLDRQGDSTN